MQNYSPGSHGGTTQPYCGHLGGQASVKSSHKSYAFIYISNNIFEPLLSARH